MPASRDRLQREMHNQTHTIEEDKHRICNLWHCQTRHSKCTMFHSNLLNTTHVLANLYDLFKPHSQSRLVSEHADLKVKNSLWKSSITEFTVGKNIIYPDFGPPFFSVWQMASTFIRWYAYMYKFQSRDTEYVRDRHCLCVREIMLRE